ncbi:hypothetical protein [Candidatus Epulonipiscium viviparus]|uniref:hypothetical protein n=1 Tax=Candidatus Epulonipiscium viviparus TaxID=420336 RepID=UPI00273812D1|nr:hypothetical protein [Candidatus Epulopiscium viviparus]
MIESDSSANVIGSDASANAVRSDASANVIGSDSSDNAVRSDVSANAVESDSSDNAVESDSSANVIGSDSSDNVIGSDASDNAIEGDAYAFEDEITAIATKTTDINDFIMESFIFGAAKAVNFGKGARAIAIRKHAEGTVVTFAGDTYLTADPCDFVAKLIGRTKDGKLVVGYV